MRRIMDSELREYQELLGPEEYRRQYYNLYNGAMQNKTKRHSGQVYENSPEKLQQIKEKYKNGIPDKEIELWLRSVQE